MSKSLVPLAATLAGLSLLAFAAGAVMLGIGIALPATGGAIFSGGGPDGPGWEDGHPVGFYLMTRYWMGTGSLEKASYYFTSDGRVYVDLEEGFSDEELARHEGRRGTVSGGDGALTFTWSDGKTQRGRLERDGDAFIWDMGNFVPVEPFTKGRALVGRWEGGSSSTFAGTHAASVRSFDLREDGTFGGGSAATLRTSGANGGSTGEHAGTWELDGYALVLTFQDGRTIRGIAFPYESDRFYFKGTMYKRLA